MGKIIKLTKVFLKNSFSRTNEKMGIDTKSKAKVLLYLLLFMYFSGIAIFFSYELISGLIEIQQETVFIGLILLMVLGIVFVQTIFSSINTLYFTKDNEYLLPLPLKPYQIILARTNVMLISEYLVVFLIGFIPLLIYGILTGCEIGYYFIMIISLIVLPILPILLINTVVMIIMNFAKITKNRNRYQLVASLILIAIILILSMSTTGIKNDISNEEMLHMVSQANSMINMVKGYFPTLDLSIESLTANSIIVAIMKLLKVIGITIIGYMIYVLIAQKIYFKGLVGNLFSGYSRKKHNKNIKQKYFANSKLYKSYIGKEFKTLIRNPIFFIQCLLPAILIPILMIGIVYLGTEKESLEKIIQIINHENISPFVIDCIILAIIQFFAMVIYISITAISREGKNAVFIKYIPVPLYKQYIYKIIPNIIMNIFTIIISLVVAEYILHLSIITIIALFIISIVMSILQSLVMIIIDLKRPKLVWDSEYAVVKQNLNLIFPVILALINIVIIAISAFLLKDINDCIGILILTILYIILNIFLYKYLYKNQDKLTEMIL